jgi:hypothetical protein
MIKSLQGGVGLGVRRRAPRMPVCSLNIHVEMRNQVEPGHRSATGTQNEARGLRGDARPRLWGVLCEIVRGGGIRTGRPDGQGARNGAGGRMEIVVCVGGTGEASRAFGVGLSASDDRGRVVSWRPAACGKRIKLPPRREPRRLGRPKRLCYREVRESSAGDDSRLRPAVSRRNGNCRRCRRMRGLSAVGHLRLRPAVSRRNGKGGRITAAVERRSCLRRLRRVLEVMQRTLRDANVAGCHSRVCVADVHVNIVASRLVCLEVEAAFERVPGADRDRRLEECSHLVQRRG